MVIKRKNATPAPEAAVGDNVTNVTVGRSFTIPGEGEYESQKVSVLVSAPSYEAASAAVETFMVSEFEKSSEQFAQFRSASDDVAKTVGTDTSEEEEELEEAEEEDAEEEEADITEDDIRAMNRSELVKLIKANELDIDYASIKNSKKLAETVIEAVAGEDAEEEEEEAEEEAEEEEVSEEDILGMSRKELVAFVSENEIEVDADDFEKTKSGTKKFAAAVIEALSEDAEEEEEEAEEEEEEEEAEEEEEEEEAEEEEGYTRKELEGMTPADLQAIYKGWGIKDKFPTGSKPIQIKKAVNRILQYQDTGK